MLGGGLLPEGRLAVETLGHSEASERVAGGGEPARGLALDERGQRPRRRGRGRRRARRARRGRAGPGRSAGGRTGRASGSRSRASARSPPSGTAGGRDHAEVLAADAEGALAVVAGLDRQDHARQQRLHPAPRQALPAPRAPRGRRRRRGRCRGRSRARPARAPPAPPRRCRARPAPRASEPRHRDHALQHQGERPHRLRRRRADRDGAGDVGGAVRDTARRCRRAAARPARPAGSRPR